MNADYSRIEALFDAALERADAAEREAFLIDACVGDEALFANVRRMLASHEAADAFLETRRSPDLEAARAAAATADTPREELGAMIGRYKLLQEIGEGGFGIVYLAEQTEPVKRKVALKVLKPGMDTREVVARFEAERQALALMDHPNIAQVYDGGSTAVESAVSQPSTLIPQLSSGRPYFVMELVKGIPLTKYCDENQLTIRRRLDLFLDVLSAVQHAHQKGIIHRDLKPSNILVSPHDGGPVVKVIDFGIAKALSMELTSRTLFTGVGQMIGTPQYMSPEQAEVNALDVDTRSDIYSLGVVLYELLTGRTPIDPKKLREAGYAEIQRLIREEQPTKPSTVVTQLQATSAGEPNPKSQIPNLKSRIPSDLDWIVMKALEKDRTRRYETANAFAADIRRHLAHEPVEAGPPSKLYRLRKLVRRNRTAFAAGAAVVVALVAGIIGTTFGMQRANESALAERKAKEDSQKRLMQVEKGNEIFTSILADLDPGAEEKEGKPLRAILGDRLDTASAQLDGDAIGDPAVAGRMLTRLGASWLGLGRPEKAVSALQRARTALEASLGPLAPFTLEARNNLANAWFYLNKHREAEEEHREIIALRTRVLGSEDPATLRSRINYANALQGQGKAAAAETEFREVIAVMEKVFGPEHPQILTSKMNLTNALSGQGKFAEAETILRELIPVQERVLGAEHHDTLQSRVNLGVRLVETGRCAEAEQEFRSLIEVMERVLSRDHPDTLKARGGLANSLNGQEKFAEAEIESRALLKIRERISGPDDRSTLPARNALANALVSQGKAAEAESEFRRLLESMERSGNAGDRNMLGIRMNLAGVLSAQNKLAEAEAENRILLAEAERMFSPDDPVTLDICFNLALAIAKNKDDARMDEALTYVRRAVEGAEKVFGPDSAKVKFYRKLEHAIRNP